MGCKEGHPSFFSCFYFFHRDWVGAQCTACVAYAKQAGAGAATIASAGAAIGIGNVLSSSIHSVARNPSLAKQSFGYAILGFALTEAIASERELSPSRRRTLDCCRVKQGKSVLVFGRPVLPMGRKGAFFTPGGKGSLYSRPSQRFPTSLSAFFQVFLNWKSKNKSLHFFGGAEQSKNETDQMIVLEWLFLTIAPCDAANHVPVVIPQLAQPLLSDEDRRNVLYHRYLLLNLGGSDDLRRMVSTIHAQLIVERYVEAALVEDGFHPPEIVSQYRDIRGSLHSPQGRLLGVRTYESYVTQIRGHGTRESVPYRRLLRAIHHYDILLSRRNRES
ncbi:hypothetical protein E3N88_46109 [Mikania micrantha]|uniref:ATP synthase subunit 9, mitochondrial n=1 Tax=Mikania micrantha TaxID=192012 RepID=A0A5N6L7H6_9ASTR|nr:hypothetical protein E3N88_46109 [Mikania micrantha]